MQLKINLLSNLTAFTVIACCCVHQNTTVLLEILPHYVLVWQRLPPFLIVSTDGLLSFYNSDSKACVLNLQIQKRKWPPVMTITCNINTVLAFKCKCKWLLKIYVLIWSVDTQNLTTPKFLRIIFLRALSSPWMFQQHYNPFYKALQIKNSPFLLHIAESWRSCMGTLPLSLSIWWSNRIMYLTAIQRWKDQRQPAWDSASLNLDSYIVDIYINKLLRSHYSQWNRKLFMLP